MKVIHQITAGFRRGDAISEEALLLREVFRNNGCTSELFCDGATIADNMRNEVAEISKLPTIVQPEDVAILHLSIGSRVNQVFSSLPCKKVILYHNVTPSQYLERLNPPMAQILEDGRKQVAALANVADVNLADSAYNARELEEMGYKNVKVLPLVIDASFGEGPIDGAMYSLLKDDGCKNILFVGRVVPNKRHDKLLEAFSYYQHYVEPRSRLIIAGSSVGQEAYKSLLLGSVHTLELQRVYFTEFISSAELNACYKAADAFLCLSDHEGFCAPLLEAMSWQIPVCAMARAAVPETMDGAGVLFNDASPAEIAEALNEVIINQPLREKIIVKQNERLARFRNRDVWTEFVGLLGE